MKLTIVFVIAALALPVLAAEETDEPNTSPGMHFGGPSSVPGQVSSELRKSKILS